MTTTPIIDVAQLSYEYPGMRALDAVSFSIAAGSITALVGPNGAGKTTLLRCLAGLDRPLAGSIAIAGIDVVDEPRRSHGAIGYLSDFYGLYADLSVYQCLAYVAGANGVATSNIATLVAEVARDTGLEQRLQQRSGDLSRGLRQRVAIAQAVIHGPRVVLLDEPASGLDPEARHQLGELFIKLRQRGMSLLVSSHILAELEAYSTDMLILRGGRVVEQRRLGTIETDHAVLQIRLTTALDELQRALAADPRVSALNCIDDRLEFRFGGDTDARAALLAELIQRGYRITHFATVSEDLQQSYLRSIHDADADPES